MDCPHCKNKTSVCAMVSRGPWENISWLRAPPWPTRESGDQSANSRNFSTGHGWSILCSLWGSKRDHWFGEMLELIKENLPWGPHIPLLRVPWSMSLGSLVGHQKNLGMGTEIQNFNDNKASIHFPVTHCFTDSISFQPVFRYKNLTRSQSGAGRHPSLTSVQ